MSVSPLRFFALGCREIGRAIYLNVDMIKIRRHNFSLSTITVYKRNLTFVELLNLVEELSNIGLPDTSKEYYNEPVEHEAKIMLVAMW